MRIVFLKAHPVAQAMSSSAKPEDLDYGDVRRSPGEPSAEQAKTGKYNKPRIEWRGLTIAVENPAGSVRRGANWEMRMKYDYGEVVGSLGVDGDPVDIFMGPNPDAPMVYVIHQNKVNDWKTYDEDKVMAGFDSEDDARQAFLSCYTDPRFMGPLTAMSVEEFVAKVRATKERPAMIKAITPLVLFFKAHVGPYLRGGKMVNLSGYHGRDARAQAGDGQLDMFARPSTPLGPNRYAGKDPVNDTIDMFDTVTEQRSDLVQEHKRLVAVLRSPSHEDDKAEAKKQEAELKEYQQGSDHDHPAPIHRGMMALIPEAKHGEWKDLHRQQHELHHYELGQIRERMSRLKSKVNKAETKMREAEAGLRDLMSAPIRDDHREAQAEQSARVARGEFEKLQREYEGLVGSHQNVYEKVSRLGRQKDAIFPGSGDMDRDFSSMRQRTAAEQQEHEKGMLQKYRDHYSGKGKIVVIAKKNVDTSSKMSNTDPVIGKSGGSMEMTITRGAIKGRVLQGFDSAMAQLNASGPIIKAAYAEMRKNLADAFSDAARAEIQNPYLDSEHPEWALDLYYGAGDMRFSKQRRIAEAHAGHALADRALALFAEWQPVVDRLEQRKSDITTAVAVRETERKERAAIPPSPISVEVGKALDAKKPELADSYRAHVGRIYESLVKELGPEFKGIREEKNKRLLDVYESTLRPVLKDKKIDGALLEQQASKYADLVADSVRSKVVGKAGEIDNPKVESLSGMDFRLTGTRGGKTVVIEQNTIVNVSSGGKLFNQFPARIYVDGVFVPEHKFKA